MGLRWGTRQVQSPPSRGFCLQFAFWSLEAELWATEQLLARKGVTHMGVSKLLFEETYFGIISNLEQSVRESTRKPRVPVKQIHCFFTFCPVCLNICRLAFFVNETFV